MQNEQKGKLFIWKLNHEKLLLREILAVEPYRFKVGTKEKGASWTKIAESLENAGLKVNQRSVREKFHKMVKDFDKKEITEKRASGVDVEFGELEQCLTDIKERMEEVMSTRQEEDNKQKKERASAEEMRKQAAESLSQTKKRKSSSNVDSDEELDESSPTGKRKRKSSSSYIDVMKESIELKKKVRATEIRYMLACS